MQAFPLHKSSFLDSSSTSDVRGTPTMFPVVSLVCQVLINVIKNARLEVKMQ